MQKTTTCVRLDEKTLKQIEQIAQKKKRKTSEMMRLIIENYCEQYFEA